MKILTYISLLGIFIMVSCDRWLDVKPDDKVYIDEVFVNLDGFEKALAGVYTSLGKQPLYGEDLKYGMLDVLAGYWKVQSTSHEYYPVKLMHYTDPKVRTRIDAIWSGLYNAIRRTNIMLEMIEVIRTNPHYDIVKGEALGLRAYLHLELFKLFGPVVKVDGFDTKAIPYYRNTDKVPSQFLTSAEILAAIATDLQNAEQLLENDPIRQIGRLGNGNAGGTNVYHQLLDRRGIRMNYYAVKALLARQAAWAGNIAEAGLRAQSLIDELKNTQAVRLLVKADMETGDISRQDVRFSVENIFGLYIGEINEYTKYRFESKYHNEYKILAPEYALFLEYIYASGTGSTTDYRSNIWRSDAQYFNKFYFFQGFTGAEDFDIHKQYEMQLISIPELFFLVAEANLARNPSKSVEYINTIRLARNLSELNPGEASYEMAKGYLLDEMRREYMGDGYMFSLYKRWYEPIIRYGGNTMPSKEIFVFPVPVDESIHNTIN